ncbi:PIG-L family deacetylase [Candidatus Woesearchaeota archaeon]|jgi:N-acetylglucosamine malate deacetylase 1|nr:PIG-L family deacetylase [Candidatus Woesearchaeota archaeon]MBT4114560.1 PIG-L family deacetylase [Candidatus Woesearchaeota archaeon]MBT4248090.1 PIG-L family deacetylase [Candidatus Woesearchaeota archaeon]
MILVLVAHPDDEILGCGGTIAKYAQDGEEVISIIFSDGDPVHKSKDFTIKRRKESIAAGKKLGISDTVFLGLPDKPFIPLLKDKHILKRINNILNKLAPKVIFTHMPDDPHPMHANISKLVNELTKDRDIEVYTFAITSPLKVKQRDMPRLYIDISDTFDEKKAALKEFKSQEFWLMYYKNITFMMNKIAGLKSHHKYAEVFYKW